MTDEERVRDILELAPGPDWDRIRNRAHQYFRGFPLRGLRVLDVGAGTGLFSVWMRVVEGAREVVALEPALGVGGYTDFVDRTRSTFARCPDGGLELVQSTLQDYVHQGPPFDAVVSLNSINHLDEVRVPLGPPGPERDRFLILFRKLHAVSAPGAGLLITDADRYCLERYTSRAGLPRLFSRGIDYDIHQQGSTWGRLAREAGYGDVRVRGFASRSLRRLGRLAGHPAVSFLTNGVFILTARRGA